MNPSHPGRFTQAILALLLAILFFLPYSYLLIQLAEHLFVVAGHPLPAMLTRLLGDWKEILLGLGLLVAGIRCIVERRLPFAVTRLDLGLIGFMMVGLIVGGLVAGNVDAALAGLRYEFTPFLYYFLARCIPLTRTQILAILRVWVLASLPILAFSFLQSIFLPASLLAPLGYQAGSAGLAGLVRGTGTFATSNDLAFYGVQVSLLLFFCGERWFTLWPARCLLAASLIVVLLTFSAGAIIGLLAALGIMGIAVSARRYRPQSIAKAGGGLLAVLLLLIVILLSFATVRFARPTGSHASPTLVQKVIEQDIPAIGIGRRQQMLATIGSHPLGEGLAVAATDYFPGPYSWYLQFGGMVGWLGLALASVLVAGVCMAFCRLSGALHEKTDRQLLGYLISGFLALMVSFVFMSAWVAPAALSWWILFGLFLSDYLGSFPADSPLFPSQNSADKGNTTAAR